MVRERLKGKKRGGAGSFKGIVFVSRPYDGSKQTACKSAEHRVVNGEKNMFEIFSSSGGLSQPHKKSKKRKKALVRPWVVVLDFCELGWWCYSSSGWVGCLWWGTGGNGLILCPCIQVAHRL